MLVRISQNGLKCGTFTCEDYIVDTGSLDRTEKGSTTSMDI